MTVDSESQVNDAATGSLPKGTPKGSPVRSVQIAETKSTTSQKKEKKVDAWNPADFMRDEVYFAVNFGLPDLGLNPFKITDISDETLICCFGEKTKNGYKLSSCTGLPVDEMVELSQVVDGYDKPVNGVLSHSFVKGVYAERIQRRKVNWAAYASAKLRGQIAQWEREKKGKPEGPPCVRKPRQYRPPSAEEHDATTKTFVMSELQHQPVQVLPMKELQPDQALIVPGSTVGSSIEEDNRVNIAVPSPVRWTSSIPVGDNRPSNLLLAILTSAMSQTASNERLLCKQLAQVRASLESLLKAERDQPKVRQHMEDEIAKAEAEFSDVLIQVERKEGVVDSLTSDIELEGNREDGSDGSESPNEFLAILESRLEASEKELSDLHARKETISMDIGTLKSLLKAKEKSFQDLPKKEARAKNLLLGIEADLKSTRFRKDNQVAEHQILAAVLEASSPVLIPRFVPTSTHTVGTQISVTNCPVCCNGYHCYNWIPASCGHTYHPACLFPLIATASSDPKCHACGEYFSHDWLRSWGLEQAGSDPSLSQSKVYVDEMVNVYGMHSARLGRRRELAAQIQSVQERVCYVCVQETSHTGYEFEHQSSMEGTCVVDLTSDDHVQQRPSKKALLTPKLEPSGSSKIVLLKPKLEPSEPELESGKFRRKAEGEVQPKKAATRSKAKHGRIAPF